MPWDHSEAQKSPNRSLFKKKREGHLRLPELVDFLANCISCLWVFWKRCEDVSGCEAIVGSSAGMIVFLHCCMLDVIQGTSA